MGQDRPNAEFLLTIEENICTTRSILGYNSENRCQICQIFESSLNNYIIKHKKQAPKPGRPLEQSPCRPMCSKFGRFMDNHSDIFCQSIMLHPQSSSNGRTFCLES